MSLFPNFLLMTRCKVNNGLLVSFWNDRWDVGVIKTMYPQMFSFGRKKCCSVTKLMVFCKALVPLHISPNGCGRSECRISVKFFLAFPNDNINTRNLLNRKNML